MTETSITSRVKLSEDVLFQELQGDAVLLDLKTGVYFGLDRVGTRMWHLMGETGTLSGVVDTILEEFDVTRDRCSADVLSLVGRLEEQGLLSVEP
jgi:hypothetical protein